MPSYEHRYCAFVDILGFQNLVAKLEREETPLHALHALLAKVQNPDVVYNDTLKDTDFRAQSISDAVCISTRRSPSGLGQIMHTLQTLTVELLEVGFFVRGAIVSGNLYHDEKMVFGQALIEAFHLENQIVRFPRVMITSEVVQDIVDQPVPKNTFDKWFWKNIRRADDGPFYLHSLRNLELHLDNARSDKKASPLPPSWTRVMQMLERRMTEAVDNPSHFEKVKWFIRYWNEIVEPRSFGNIQPLRGPGLDHPVARWA